MGKSAGFSGERVRDMNIYNQCTLFESLDFVEKNKIPFYLWPYSLI